MIPLSPPPAAPRSCSRTRHAAMDRTVLAACGWPAEIRDEVLARLLALNAERAAQE
jgi:hypothetical protein